MAVVEHLLEHALGDAAAERRAQRPQGQVVFDGITQDARALIEPKLRVRRHKLMRVHPGPKRPAELLIDELLALDKELVRLFGKGEFVLSHKKIKSFLKQSQE